MIKLISILFAKDCIKILLWAYRELIWKEEDLNGVKEQFHQLYLNEKTQKKKKSMYKL